jgi:hypothetical protein
MKQIYSQYLSYCIALSLTLLFAVYGSGGISTVLKYTRHCSNKLTSVGLLEGRLHYSRPLAEGIEDDMQIYDGAQFTNWGYGVAILQTPFHFAYRLFKHGYFPDRLIYFFYFFVCCVFLSLSFKKLFETQFGYPAPLACALATVLILFIFTFSLFRLTSFRFIAYEETLAYLVLGQLLILSFYIFYYLERRPLWIYLAAFTASFCLVIRGSSAFILLVWATCFFLLTPRNIIHFCVGAIPSTLFWICSNYAKSGSYFALGYQNTIPGDLLQTPLVRFQTPCGSSFSKALEVFFLIFRILFIGDTKTPESLLSCQFAVERGKEVPYIGPVFLLLLIFALAYHVKRNPKKLDFYIPYLGIVGLFAAYAFGGISFNIRYAYDFWPFLVLIAVQFLMFHGLRFKTQLPYVFCILPLISVFIIQRDVVTNFHTLALSESSPSRAQCWDRSAAETEAINHFEQPSSFICKQLHGNAAERWMGWSKNCEVTGMSSFLLGLPKSEDSARHFTLELTVNRRLEEAPRVYINGSYYETLWRENAYYANFDITRRELISSLLLVSVRWNRDYSTPSLKLLSAKFLKL